MSVSTPQLADPRGLVRFQVPDLITILVSVVALGVGLTAAPSFGSVAYILPPAALLATAAILFVLRTFFQDTRSFIILLVFFAACVLDLSFRVREMGAAGLDVQNGVKFGAWILMLLLGLRFRRYWPVALRDPATALVVAYASFCLMSTLWSPVPSYTFACAVGNFAWLSLALGCAISLDEAILLRVLAWGLGCECLIGLLTGLFVPDVGWLQDYDSFGVRLAGLSGHPNLLAQHAALLLIIGATAWERGFLGRKTTAGLCTAAVAALVLAASRTTFLAIGFAFTVTYLRRHNNLARATLLALVLSSAVLLLLNASGFMPPLDGIMTSLSRSGDATEITTATNRSELWTIAWRHFLERPLLGWGFNGTEQLMADSVESNFPGNAVNAHNLGLQALMSLGLIGSALVGGYLFLLIVRIGMRPDAFRDRLVVFLLALGLGEAEYLSVPVLMTFLIFWCVLRDADRTSTKSDKPTVDQTRGSRPAVKEAWT